jgi:hypothetical protein
MLYKEIFVAPREKVLNELKEKEKNFEHLFTKGAAKQYDRILNIQKDEELLQQIRKEKNPSSTLVVDRKGALEESASTNKPLLLSGGARGQGGAKDLYRSVNNLPTSTKESAHYEHSTNNVSASAVFKNGQFNHEKEGREHGVDQPTSIAERKFFDQQIQV